MRVLCINAGPMEGDVPGEPVLQEGHTYHVKREVDGLDDNNKVYKCYELWETDPLYAFQKERFIPVMPDDHEISLVLTHPFHLKVA